MVFYALTAGVLLFFTCLKKSNQKKGHPDSPPFGFSALLDEAGAAQLALCFALFSAQTVLAMIPLRLRCSAGNNGTLRAL